MKKLLIFIIFISCFISNILLMNTKAEELEIKNIGVDIKGAVLNPGYYIVSEDSTVYDVIGLSGGLMSYADTSIINLSKKVSDEDVIIVYTIDEVNEMKRGNTSIKIIEKECVCPKIDNVACIGSSDNKDLININTASLDELMTLSGIGKSKAQSIIDYRAKTPFNVINDLMKVKGIGTGIFDKIKTNITV